MYFRFVNAIFTKYYCSQMSKISTKSLSSRIFKIYKNTLHERICTRNPLVCHSSPSPYRRHPPSLYLKNPSLFRSKTGHLSDPKWKNLDLHVPTLPIASLSFEQGTGVRTLLWAVLLIYFGVTCHAKMLSLMVYFLVIAVFCFIWSLKFLRSL